MKGKKNGILHLCLVEKLILLHLKVPLELAAEKEAVGRLVKEWKGTKEGAEVSCDIISMSVHSLFSFIRMMTTLTST